MTGRLQDGWNGWSMEGAAALLPPSAIRDGVRRMAPPPNRRQECRRSFSNRPPPFPHRGAAASADFSHRPELKNSSKVYPTDSLRKSAPRSLDRHHGSRS